MSSKHYFACGNTSKGFQNLFATNLCGLSKLFILKGGPGNGKSTLMKKIGKKYESDYEVEYIHCSGDSQSLDAVIVRELGFGIVDGTAPHVIEPKLPGCIEEYVNLGAAWDTSLLKKSEDTIKRLNDEISQCYARAYVAFSKGIRIHDEWEDIYIKEMDFKKADELTESVLREVFSNTKQNCKESKIYHRFFGAATCDGSIDFVENLIEPMEKRYFIKGRPGSGKSTLLKKLLVRAQMKGLDVEVYHCGFDPGSLDMILLPEIKTVVFDSTAPHEYFPSRESDIIIDMYAELITPGTDEKYKDKLDNIVARYKACVAEGTSYLHRAKVLHDELEEYYKEATYFKVIELLTSQILASIK